VGAAGMGLSFGSKVWEM